MKAENLTKQVKDFLLVKLVLLDTNKHVTLAAVNTGWIPLKILLKDKSMKIGHQNLETTMGSLWKCHDTAEMMQQKVKNGLELEKELKT